MEERGGGEAGHGGSGEHGQGRWLPVVGALVGGDAVAGVRRQKGDQDACRGGRRSQSVGREITRMEVL